MQIKSRQTKDFKSWLDQMQQDSWQLELLISGFAIFGLVGAYGPLQELIAYVFLQPNDVLGFLSVLGVMLLNAAWIVFTVNLIIHVFLRGLWIGTLGLRYVSGDIEYDKLNYSQRFTNKFRKSIGSFDDYIEKLERYSSVMFAYTFLLFFIFLSVISLLIFLILIVLLIAYFSGGKIRSYSGGGFNINLSEVTSMIVLPLVFLLMLSAVFVAIDFLMLGRLKKVKNRYFSFVYYKMNWIISILSLSFLWRPLLLNFLDLKFTRVLVFSAIPYGFVLAFLAPNMKLVHNQYYPAFDINNRDVISESFHPRYYDDERAQRMNNERLSVNYFCIPSKVIRERFLQVFVKNDLGDRQLIMVKDSTIYPLQKTGMKSILSGSGGDIEHPEKTFRKKLFDEQLKLYQEVWNEQQVTSTDQQDKIKELTKIFNNQEKIYDQQNLKKLKEVITGFSRFRINDQYLDDGQILCQFYEHPLLYEKGILCHINLDSLPLGMHALTLEREVYKGRIDTLSLTIPFVYDKYD